jgi:phosphatidylserine decarboxylase
MNDSDYDKPSLVIGVFMSFYDPHIIRTPYSGIIQYKSLEPIESTNRPMLAVEKDILNEAINPNNLGYLKYNERMLVKIYSPSLDYTYYMCLIADEDVNVIMPFTIEQNESFSQNQRFALVRWGSQTEIILPFDDRYEFELCQNNHMHIEAGLDTIVKITHK